MQRADFPKEMRLLHQRLNRPMHDEIRHGGDESRAREGENPGSNYALAPNPADGADAPGGADAEDRAGDRMGRRDGNAHPGGGNDRKRGGRFGAKAAYGL